MAASVLPPAESLRVHAPRDKQTDGQTPDRRLNAFCQMRPAHKLGYVVLCLALIESAFAEKTDQIQQLSLREIEQDPNG